MCQRLACIVCMCDVCTRAACIVAALYPFRTSLDGIKRQFDQRSGENGAVKDGKAGAVKGGARALTNVRSGQLAEGTGILARGSTASTLAQSAPTTATTPFPSTGMHSWAW